MEIRAKQGSTLKYYSQFYNLPHILLQHSNPGQMAAIFKSHDRVRIPGYLDSKDGSDTAKIRIEEPLINPKIRYDFSALQKDIEVLTEAYPFMEKRIIGKSVLNKPIIELRIGRGPKKIHWNGSFHGNEWITTCAIMKFLNEYLAALTTGRNINKVDPLQIYESTTLSIVPMVNPDGVDLVLNGPPPEQFEKLYELNGQSGDFTGWKANIRGVDLNKQYPAKWQEQKQKGVSAPSPRDFGGTEPLCEPESSSMARLAEDSQFDLLLAFHTQGKEFYWGYEGMEPPESKIIAEAFAKASPYQSVKDIDSFAGYKDWFIKKFRKPGFTIELGKGINPLPLSQFDEIYREVFGIFLTSLIVL
ncbi:M14 family metallopeptidase [Falsibacillus pallidus]|uniref:M14 family metallopeptidase n=1 Tax=Falsibacillus pallidus TaxID=493781 RepID=UPI003D97EE29